MSGRSEWWLNWPRAVTKKMIEGAGQLLFASRPLPPLGALPICEANGEGWSGDGSQGYAPPCFSLERLNSEGGMGKPVTCAFQPPALAFWQIGETRGDNHSKTNVVVPVVGIVPVAVSAAGVPRIIVERAAA